MEFVSKSRYRWNNLMKLVFLKYMKQSNDSKLSLKIIFYRHCGLILSHLSFTSVMSVLNKNSLIFRADQSCWMSHVYVLIAQTIWRRNYHPKHPKLALRWRMNLHINEKFQNQSSNRKQIILSSEEPNNVQMLQKLPWISPIFSGIYHMRKRIGVFNKK